MGDKIVVIGSVNMDLSVKVKDMPLVGETIIGKSISYIPGGKGANQAGAIGKLGGDVVFLASIGDDAFGKVQIETLSSYKVDCTKFKINKGCSTGTAIIYVNDKGDNNIVVIPEANALLDKTYIDDNISFLEDSSYVLLQMEIPYDTMAYALKEAKKRDNIVILNPAPAGDIDEAINFAIKAASISVTKLGAMSSLPTLEEVENL